tara:strand:+ start:153 stop:674 length:522 start_codon:yes stop_codon:yes gene_type:complete
MLKKIILKLVHILLPTRRFLIKYLKNISSQFNNSEIIEIGSGDITKNQSAEKYFQNVKLFKKTDINKAYGHKYIDITEEITFSDKYDLVLCTNVLEHVFEIQQAIKNLKKITRKGGNLIISVPFIYPLHDEPSDYWRLTEHSLRQLFDDFEIVDFKINGLRQFPIQYILLLRV